MTRQSKEAGTCILSMALIKMDHHLAYTYKSKWPYCEWHIIIKGIDGHERISTIITYGADA